MIKAVCKASGIPYNPNRERVNDAGVRRRLTAVQRKRLQLLTKAGKRPKLKP
jgi:hypothetical protein